MKHKTSELEDAYLDAAVAKAESGSLKGREYSVEGGGVYDPTTFRLNGSVFAPSHDWAQGGQIIEREKITLLCPSFRPELWAAIPSALSGSVKDGTRYGPTPLIAAMRAYVSSKFGDDVELP
jgi:hypothetical protein